MGITLLETTPLVLEFNLISRLTQNYYRISLFVPARNLVMLEKDTQQVADLQAFTFEELQVTEERLHYGADSSSSSIMGEKLSAFNW